MRAAQTMVRLGSMDPKKRSLGDAFERIAEEAEEASDDLDQSRGGDTGRTRGDHETTRGGDDEEDTERGGSDDDADQGRGGRG